MLDKSGDPPPWSPSLGSGRGKNIERGASPFLDTPIIGEMEKPKTVEQVFDERVPPL